MFLFPAVSFPPLFHSQGTQLYQYWDETLTGYSLWKQLSLPSVMTRLWILAESLFYSLAFICPFIPSQSVALFVCLPRFYQPQSLTNPSPSLPHSIVSSLQRPNTSWPDFRDYLQKLFPRFFFSFFLLVWRQYSSCQIFHIISPATTAGPKLHAPYLRLVGA